MVPEQNYEETDRLEMLLLRRDVLSDFLLDTWKADFKTSSKWWAIPNVDPRSLSLQKSKIKDLISRSLQGCKAAGSPALAAPQIPTGI